MLVERAKGDKAIINVDKSRRGRWGGRGKSDAIRREHKFRGLAHTLPRHAGRSENTNQLT